MARARNIKPGFFTNELLGTYDPIISLLFAGLWCLADKEGILEDRPLRIKAELFPYRDGLDINGYLTVLERDGFVERYVVDRKPYIIINHFDKHQHPHHTEKPKGYPKPPQQNSDSAREYTLTPLSNGDTPSDSLIPDSLIPDSLIPDSLIPDSLIPDSLIPDSNSPTPTAPVNGSGKAAKKPAAKPITADVWEAYAKAYSTRYGIAPVRNGKVNGQLKQFVERIGAAEAPEVARAYLANRNALYVSAKHCTDLLLRDAEKLRTEWATGNVTHRRDATEEDRLSSTGQMWERVGQKLAAKGIT